MQPTHRLLTTLVAITLIVGSVGAISARSWLQDGDQGLVAGSVVLIGMDGADLVTTPATDAEVLDRLAPGTPVRIVGEVQEEGGRRWWPVQVVASGMIGFVQEDDLIVVSPDDALRPPPGPDDLRDGTPGVAEDLREPDDPELQVLPPYEGHLVQPVAMSPGGLVLGRVGAIDDASVTGVIWRDGAWEAIAWDDEAVHGAGFEPVDINDQGQVAGVLILPGGGTQAVRWEAGNLLPLTPPLGNDDRGLRPAGINNRGDIVGWGTIVAEGTPEAGTAAYWWTEAEGGRALPANTLTSRAFAINDTGVAVGINGGEPVLWHGGQFVTLPYPEESDPVFAIAINEAGQVIGNTTQPSPRPLLWTAQTLHELPVPEGCEGHTSGITAAGQIVGVVDCGEWRVAIWTVATEGTQLSIVPGPDNWRIQSVIDMSDDGVLLLWAAPEDGSQAGSAALWRVPEGEYVEVVPVGTPGADLPPAGTPDPGVPPGSPPVPAFPPPDAGTPPGMPPVPGLPPGTPPA